MFRVNIQNVAKQYKIYHKPVDRLFEALFRRKKHTLFKALEDISFNIGMHRSLGLIGDNGAGKSTLLKLLAGTVQASSGNIEVNGRVAALLELGAGFHPEFSGRQNIYLNASLFGIPSQEIKKREEDIIIFSQLQDFIDRPVKTYSSGMYVRLAFSIATMVDPDILIIDEALAVGDIAFQKKCIDRMNKFKKDGKTMIFCSHSMYHIQELCDQVIWLEHGRIREKGDCDDIISNYQDFCTAKQENIIVNDEQKDQNVEKIQIHDSELKDCRILSFKILSDDKKEINAINSEDNIIMQMEVEILSNQVTPHFGFAVMSSHDPDEFIAAKLTNYEAIDNGPYQIGEILIIQLYVDFFPIRIGTFLLLAGVADESGLFWYEYKYIGPISIIAKKGLGHVAMKGKWQIDRK